MYLGHITAASSADLAFNTEKPKHEDLSGKRAFDLVVATLGLVAVSICAAALLILNPYLNPGPLFFRQRRMGKDGKSFWMWKFRTMSVCANGTSVRPILTPLEVDRITPFAQLLRKYRIDELPNFINVFRGEMSVIGPRPDAWEHSKVFSGSVPNYKERFRVRPGITGLAQVRGGYAECSDAVRRKARFDCLYVKARSWKMEIFVLWQTALVIATGFGAK